MHPSTPLPPRRRALFLSLLLGFLPLLTPAVSLYAAGIIYAAPGGTGAQTGGDWANAKDLQAALQSATSGDQVWVKAGTYKPSSTVDRSATFQLKSGVALYGGFAGNETNLDQRNPATHISTLSGDLLGNDTGAPTGNNPARSDNSYHVVTSSGTDATTLLDGFTITAGNANGSTLEDHFGGGLLNVLGSPILRSLILMNNSATTSGGGMYNYISSNPTLHDSSFINNTADDSGGGLTSGGNSVFTSTITMSRMIFSGNSAPFGGGIFSERSDIVINHAVFQGNTATIVGGGIISNYGHTTIAQALFIGNTSQSYGSSIANFRNDAAISQVTLSDNTSANNGGALVNQESSPLIYNSIFWGNHGGQIHNLAAGNTPDVQYSLVQGGYISGTHILDADPLFVDADGIDNIPGTADDNLRLQAASPAVDSGNNAFIPLDLTDENHNNIFNEPAPFDLDGNPRLDDGSVDLGAYESQLHFHITSALPPAGTYGSSYSHTFTTSSQTPVTYSLTAGNLPPGLTLTSQGELSGVPIQAGSYSGIVVEANSAYGSDTQAFSITVDRAPLTISADAKTRAFGAPNPPLTASYSGFVNGDTPASLDAPPVLNTTATIASPPGRYPITAVGAADANYTMTLIPATLTITGSRTQLALIRR